MQSEWYFVVSDNRVGDRLERDTPSKRPYLITKRGTWVHRDDLPYVLSLERDGCRCKGGGMVKPAYYLAKASAEQLADIPEE